MKQAAIRRLLNKERNQSLNQSQTIGETTSFKPSIHNIPLKLDSQFLGGNKGRGGSHARANTFANLQLKPYQPENEPIWGINYKTPQQSRLNSRVKKRDSEILKSETAFKSRNLEHDIGRPSVFNQTTTALTNQNSIFR